jgi:CRP-like cAMP-binding protein
LTHRAALRDALGDVSLFAACSKRDLQIIARHMQVVSVPEGTVLMREGEHGDAFFVVLEGSARMARGGRRVGEVGPGEHVGELALLDPAPRSATVTALGPMTVGAIDARTFAAIVRDVPALTIKLLAALARRLRERDRQATAP